MNRSHLSDDDMEDLRNEIPAGRLGTPEEVAAMVLKVIESPSYMTGQIITLDGGWI
jgi:3-oxoacyl-[acyl-carrier protein] reductase